MKTKKTKQSEISMMTMSRRDLILNAMAAGGYMGLRSLLIGVSPAFLATRAIAATGAAKFLVFSESIAGDPVNCNVPGTYGVAGVKHPTVALGGAGAADFETAFDFDLGSVRVSAAKAWSNLLPEVRQNFHFVHYRSASNAHPESPEVMTVMGSVRAESGSGPETIPSAIAQEVAEALGVMQPKPFVLKGALTYAGVSQPQTSPRKIKSVFTAQSTDLTKKMLEFRDQQIDSLYSDLKSNGTPAQKSFLDNFALSRKQSRLLSENLVTYLETVTSDSDVDQMKTAAALIALNAAPAIRVSINFGGDNHEDNSLTQEMNGHINGIEAINQLYTSLAQFGMQDKVVFSLMNVFGRTLFRSDGRDHWGPHSVGLLFGSSVKPGVSGGIDASWKSTGINSVNGSMNQPDITPDLAHASAVQTLMSACGVSEDRIKQRVRVGKIIKNIVG